LAASKLVTIRNVEVETAMLLDEVVRKATELATLITAGGTMRAPPDISVAYRECRTCEFRVTNSTATGFRECWGNLAEDQPHILDLYRVSQIGTTKFPDPVPGLLQSGRATLLGLREDQLGKEGVFRERRLIQWQHSHDGGSEYQAPALLAELRQHESSPGWPLRFIDFEACNIALPHHAGLRPYDRVAFQWSCHTLTPDGRLQHSEWLNTEREIPNFAFARSLRDAIGDTGTVYVWSHYEQSTLRRILEQLSEWIQRDSTEALRLSGLPSVASLGDLSDWLGRLLGPEDAKKKRHSPRIRDLHALALDHYFHPRMGGRTSIKVVLPAVWEININIRRHSFFREYDADGSDGRPVDPYKTLPALPLGDDDSDDVIYEGTGAIRVYQDLIFSTDSTSEIQANRCSLLLQYCRLDTAAMVMIWMHWRGPESSAMQANPTA
jgi:hypothetical protein